MEGKTTCVPCRTSFSARASVPSTFTARLAAALRAALVLRSDRGAEIGDRCGRRRPSRPHRGPGRTQRPPARAGASCARHLRPCGGEAFRQRPADHAVGADNEHRVRLVHAAAFLVAPQGDQVVGHGVEAGMHHFIVHGEDEDVMEEPLHGFLQPRAVLAVDVARPARRRGIGLRLERRHAEDDRAVFVERGGHVAHERSSCAAGMCSRTSRA